MQDPLAACLAEKYPAVAGDLLGPLLDILILSRDLCGGDLDKFLVLLAIGMRTVAHPGFANAQQGTLLSGELPIFPTLGINTRSVAESLRIPKETTRRKVAELIELGWVHRSAHHLHFTAKAYKTLAPIRVEIERAALKYYKAINALAAIKEPV
jgi:hypothetical protein